MKKFAFKSIRTRLTFWFLILSLIPLGATLVITYYQRVHVIESRTFDKLTAIRDLKVERLNDWLIERKGDIYNASTDRGLTDLEDAIKNDFPDQNKIAIVEYTRRILNRYMKHFNAYSEIFIIDPNTGKIIVSTNKLMEGADKSDDVYFTTPMQSRELFIKDIYYSKTMAGYAMVYSIPILCFQHSGKHIVGILVARLDLNNSLYRVLNDRVGLGKTGETLIVNKDIMALNELRWHKDAPLNLKIAAKPAVNAAHGKTGITITEDYRQEKVLAAYTYIPKTEWGFVCKQDLYELNAPIREMVVDFVILFVIITMFILLFAFYLSKSISKPVIDVDKATQKIMKGDYAVRNVVQSKDELGMLATSVNEMAESIESKNTVQKCIMDISDTIIGQSTMEQFGSALLKQLIMTTDSTMGVFYILNEVKHEFEPLTSVGANTDLLRTFNADNPEGELGNAVSQKNIYYLKNIPRDTLFKYKTSAGDVIPKEMITIPILIGDIVVAIISLANVHKFSREATEILELSLNNINSAYSDLLANERARLLAENLTKTNQQLEAQAEELQSQSEELQQTAEELQEQNLELDVQRKQVEEANRLKSEFLSNMSHELRTPLNSVMALSRVLLMQAKDKLSEEESNYLEIIERNGKNLLSLINNILDLSKIEAGRMDVNPKTFQVSATIETIVERLEPIAENKGIQLNQQISDDLPHIESDESRVHQILQNLIGNAVKFTEQGNVFVSAHSDAEKIHITVSDTGIGISKKDLPYIFDEFRQVDGTSARPYEGTGLGLAIAFRAARMLGGEISVKSTLEKGSTFALTLPVRWQGIVSSSESIVFKPSVGMEPTRKTVLIVDDEPDNLTMISSYLSTEGYNTITATSGQEAIRLAKIHRPYAITLDIIMPEMDGFEVLDKIRSNPETRDLPVIVVTAKDLTAEERKKLSGNVSSILEKSDTTSTALLEEIKKTLISIGRQKNRVSAKERESFDRILLVEDNEAAVIQVKAVLEEEGYIVDVAPGGKEALDFMSRIIPDGIILDLMMPEIDGFQVLEEMRSTEATAKVPVLILTARDLTPEDLNRLSSNNIQQLIQKGDVDRENLLFKVRLMLGNLKQETETPDTEKPDTEKPDPEKPARGINGKPATILVVEDNPDNMITIKAILNNQYNILEATDGEKGLHLALTEQPDLILLDMSLPGMDGYTVASRLKQDKDAGHIPIIALSAHAMKGDREKMIEAGCDEYIPKPIDPEGLLGKIRECLKLNIEKRELKT